VSFILENISIIKRAKRKYRVLKQKRYDSEKKDFIRKITEEEKLIILGNQKTGSTVIADLVSKRSGKSVMLDVLGALNEPEWLLKQRYGLSDLSDFIYRHRDEFGRNILKEPSLTFFYADLVKIFPNAKASFIIRNPLNNIRSILNRLNIPGNLDNIRAEDWPELENMPTWKLALDSTWLGYPEGNYVEALAYRWCAAADVYLKNKDKIYLLEYEKFLSDKSATIDEFCKFHGLALKEDISHLVDTQYQRKGISDVDLHMFFGKSNYDNIMKICDYKARQFGYKIK